MKKILALLSILFLAMQTFMAQPKLMTVTEEAKYSIVYALNGGKNNSKNPTDYAANATVILKAPKRPNYKFDGWYWDSRFTKKVENSKFSQKTGAIKVYAKWTRIPKTSVNTKTSVDFTKFEQENMVEIIPAGYKVLLEDFAGKDGAQNVFGYSISKYEVTQAFFTEVMKFNPSHFLKGNDTPRNKPVENVTWYDAVMFCNELTKKIMSQDDCCYTITDIEKNENGNIYYANVTRDESKKGYRLPTEAEWEMAARGGVKGDWDCKYAGSNNIDEVAWYDWNSRRTTHIVGIKKANKTGLYDMSGNVWEWCDNLYSGGSSFRAARGGSWYSYNDTNLCRVSDRYYYYPYRAYNFLGFRICRGL